MKTITITEAKRSLGRYLQRAAAGEEIGIVSGADIVALRKVEVVPVDRLRETPSSVGDDDWPAFEAVDGGPVDGASGHDKYLYDEPHGSQTRRRRK